MGLITYNVASVALQSWWQDFDHFRLIHLKNLRMFAQERYPNKEGSALYSMEINQFFNLQYIYRQKVQLVFKDIWLRGVMAIVKKFKWLKHDPR